MSNSSYLPLLLVTLVSMVAGVLLVIVFGYTSDQKAIASAKAKIQAHLLEVQLFQDQLSIVMRSYGRIVLGAGHYLRLTFVPVLVAALPLTLLIAQLDHYFGERPMSIGRAFLVKVKTDQSTMLDQLTLQAPPQIELAGVVHIPADNEVVWNLIPRTAGTFVLNIGESDQQFGKRVVVSSRLTRVSDTRLRGQFFRRMLVSDEAALPAGANLRSIEITYPARTIRLLGIDANWIWLFFIFSMIAGFAAKSALRIEI